MTGPLSTPARAWARDTLQTARRDPWFDFEARNGTVNFCTCGAVVKMLDIDTRRYRLSTLRDVYVLVRLYDTLQNCTLSLACQDPLFTKRSRFFETSACRKSHWEIA